jgi:hypothetical protein
VLVEMWMLSFHACTVAVFVTGGFFCFVIGSQPFLGGQLTGLSCDLGRANKVPMGVFSS